MTQTIKQKHWNIRLPNPKAQTVLSNGLGVHPIVTQLLINRGIETVEEARQFMSAELGDLHDPFLLMDMDKAIQRVHQAREQKERVLIFGDYDVDGVTSSALLYKALQKLGIQAENHIPHRMTDGYGLNGNIAETAKEKGVSLLIAVDCGITANKEVERLNQHQIDVIIIDHHEPSEEGIPQACAVVNPKRADCPYPFKHLASVGLVAKFTHALFGEVQRDVLDLVALGTIADVVKLRGENRIFVKAGLPMISQTKNLGLSALLEVAKIKGKTFRPHYAGFILGPRLNATGRIDSAHKSLDLLLSENVAHASGLAQLLETLNGERQRLQRQVIQEAVAQIEELVDFEEQKVIVLYKEGWHKGVLGIVASRVAEMYYRPAIIISLEGGTGTASARSVAGFHLHDALSSCQTLLETFGGHKLAAGLTIREENISGFRRMINEFAGDLLEDQVMVPTLDIDCEVPLSSLTLNLLNKINSLEPYGEGNPEPVFCTRQVIVKSAPMVLGRDTLKFWVTDGQVMLSAVGFGMGKYGPSIHPGQKIDLAYQLIVDDYRKAPTVQLKIKDIKEVRD